MPAFSAIYFVWWLIFMAKSRMNSKKCFQFFFTGWCRLQPAYNAIHFSFIFNMFFHILLLPCSWYYYFFMGEFLLYFFLELYLCMWMQCRKNCTHKYIDRHIHTIFYFIFLDTHGEQRKIVVDNFFGPSLSHSLTCLHSSYHIS